MICNSGIGCSHYCPYCYASAYSRALPQDIAILYENIPDLVKEEIHRLSIFFRFYISSTTDCYQPIPEFCEMIWMLVE
ncbi:MAG: hypothetical protein ACFFAS_18330 [Promethearchaeota archaeon]